MQFPLVPFCLGPDSELNPWVRIGYSLDLNVADDRVSIDAGTRLMQACPARMHNAFPEASLN